MGDVGVPVLCYNFMPIFDWTRTDLAMLQPDGSTALAYDDDALSRIDLSRGTGDFPDGRRPTMPRRCTRYSTRIAT